MDTQRSRSPHIMRNSIELIWAMLKGKVVRSNLTLKKKDVKKLREDAFEAISPEDWTNTGISFIFLTVNL